MPSAVAVSSGVSLVGSNIMVDGGTETTRRVGSDVIVNMRGQMIKRVGTRLDSTTRSELVRDTRKRIGIDGSVVSVFRTRMRMLIEPRMAARTWIVPTESWWLKLPPGIERSTEFRPKLC